MSRKRKFSKLRFKFVIQFPFHSFPNFLDKEQTQNVMYQVYVLLTRNLSIARWTLDSSTMRRRRPSGPRMTNWETSADDVEDGERKNNLFMPWLVLLLLFNVSSERLVLELVPSLSPWIPRGLSCPGRRLESILIPFGEMIRRVLPFKQKAMIKTDLQVIPSIFADVSKMVFKECEKERMPWNDVYLRGRNVICIKLSVKEWLSFHPSSHISTFHWKWWGWRRCWETYPSNSIL